MSRTLVCDCESPLLTLDADRTPHCEKCGRSIVGPQAALVVRLVQTAIGRGIALDEAFIDALAEAVAGMVDDAVSNGASDSKPVVALPRVEAAEAVGMSLDSFERYVQPEVRLIRRGSLRVVPLSELERWVEENAEQSL